MSTQDRPDRERPPYEKPSLERFGTLRELTQARMSLGMGDTLLPACADDPARIARS